MRAMRYTGAAVLTVPAAHSRKIQPGEVVDFDEVIGTFGTPYTLEQALMGDAEEFAAAPEPVEETPLEPAVEPVADVVPTDPEPEPSAAAPEPVEEPKRGGRGKKS